MFHLHRDELGVIGRQQGLAPALGVCSIRRCALLRRERRHLLRRRELFQMMANPLRRPLGLERLCHQVGQHGERGNQRQRGHAAEGDGFAGEHQLETRRHRSATLSPLGGARLSLRRPGFDGVAGRLRQHVPTRLAACVEQV